MKYKLSDKLNAFLTDNVLPQFKDGVEKNILKSFGESDILLAKMFSIDAKKTVYGIEFSIALMRNDLVEIEPLIPHVWYKREKFDGNPNNYVVLECDQRGRCDSFSTYAQGKDASLRPDTTHFMYVTKPNK